MVLYYAGSLLATIFQCTPVDHYWHPDSQGHCTNGDNILIVPGAINCVLDALIIFLVSTAFPKKKKKKA